MKPDQIKSWLKENGRDRVWLAKQCSVSKSTVDGWMANRPIPKPTQSVLAALIYSDRPLSPKFTMEQFAKIQQRAKTEGVSVESWIEKAVVGALSVMMFAFLAVHLWRSPSAWDALALSKTAGVIVAAMAR